MSDFHLGGRGAPYQSLSQTSRCIMCPHHIITHCAGLQMVFSSAWKCVEVYREGGRAVYNATIVRRSWCLPPVHGIGLAWTKPSASGSISDFGLDHPSCGISHLWINWIIGQVSCHLHFESSDYHGLWFWTASIWNLSHFKDFKKWQKILLGGAHKMPNSCSSKPLWLWWICNHRLFLMFASDWLWQMWPQWACMPLHWYLIKERITFFWLLQKWTNCKTFLSNC